jgi:hypothetical protein
LGPAVSAGASHPIGERHHAGALLSLWLTQQFTQWGIQGIEDMADGTSLDLHKINIFGISPGWSQMDFVQCRPTPKGQMSWKNRIRKKHNQTPANKEILFDHAICFPRGMLFPFSQVVFRNHFRSLQSDIRLYFCIFNDMPPRISLPLIGELRFQTPPLRFAVLECDMQFPSQFLPAGMIQKPTESL